METTMPTWKIQINLHHKNDTIEIDNVKIKRGIFQGDSLSPLLFCIAIDPLSKILKSSSNGYNLYGKKKRKN